MSLRPSSALDIVIYVNINISIYIYIYIYIYKYDMIYIHSFCSRVGAMA